MKKISLLVVLASICLAISPASAQAQDTTKNKVEIKKKTKIGANGQQETKIKMETKGTPEAVTGAVESAVTGKARAATPATPATPAQPASPSVIVVQSERAKPETVTKVVTVPVKTPVTTTKTTTTTINRSIKPATRKVVKKPVTASSTTTTTTTVKKD